MIRRLAGASLLALSLAACATVPASETATAPLPAPAAAAFQPASLDQLVSEVKLPYEKFVLDNGLTVIVHEDHKAPLVGVSVWYDVGSKHEPAGKTGFAHLFEHLMFNGTENAPQDWFEYVEQAGGTDVNGTTNADRTNYFETVPTGALDRILMLESDRMGHLLKGVTQQKLDNQRGVVQNEKRQGDNQPYGLLRYEIFENLFPSGHPYHHSTIGSMADLNSASLDDVKKWFTDHYGPNNAVLVIAGDVDVATAKAKAQEWFGDIPRGPEAVSPPVSVPDLPAAKTLVTTDNIATTRIYRMWTIPGSNAPESVPLALGASVLGGLSSSRLDNALVRNDPVAVSVAAYSWTLEDAGVFIVQADVKPGVDANEVAAKLDAQMADFLAKGPTADELQRAKVSTMASVIRGLESVGGFGGKAPVLASGELFMGDPGQVEKELAEMAAATPETVAAETRKWLSRPVFNMVMNPGERTAGGENRGGAVRGPARIEDVAQANYCPGDSCDPTQFLDQANADRSQLPTIANLAALDFPAIERATLKNGMKVFFAHRDAVPTVSVLVDFDAGGAAETKANLGVQRMLLETMDEGTADLDSTAFAEAQERLGASLSSGRTSDWTTFSLAALSPNLAPSLALFADYIREPGLRDGDIARVRSQMEAALASELKNPNQIARRAAREVLFGNHPYGLPDSGLGTVATLEGADRAALEAFHDTWLRPDNARIYVVGDTSLAEVTKLLNDSFGDWQAPATALPQRGYASAPIPAADPRIVLIDRPGSPQSVIYAGEVLGLKGTDDLTVINAANEALGGGFLARINSNLRESKGWSYGSYSGLGSGLDRINFAVSAPVQADKTGDAIAEIRREVREFVTTRGVQPDELARVVNGSVRQLPGQFETADNVLAGLVNIVRYGRPDNYYETLAGRYGAMTAAQLDAAGRAEIKDANLTYIVVGDAKTVRPQLEKLGLKIVDGTAQ